LLVANLVGSSRQLGNNALYTEKYRSLIKT
jgi:hypothetical protein